MGERQLLGDHAAHRDADHVGGLDLQRVEQAAASPAMSAIVKGSSAWPESPMPRLSKTMQSKLLLELGEEGPAPGQVGGAHPLDQQHRLALAGALVVQLRPRCIDARHRRRSYANRLARA